MRSGYWEALLAQRLLWVNGSGSSVKTSNTMNIFAILNEAKILSPLTSLYFYSAISSGQKINEGHELKFQF